MESSITDSRGKALLEADLDQGLQVRRPQGRGDADTIVALRPPDRLA